MKDDIVYGAPVNATCPSCGRAIDPTDLETVTGRISETGKLVARMFCNTGCRSNHFTEEMERLARTGCTPEIREVASRLARSFSDMKAVEAGIREGLGERPGQ